MVSEETFAIEEANIGKIIHLHDGIWWVRTAPFYFKPVHIFRQFAPGTGKPSPLRALGGYSHQVPAESMGTRSVVLNILEGESLRQFSMERLKSEKRRAIRKGYNQCIIKEYMPTSDNLEQMRLCNISLAQRCKGVRAPNSFLPEEYYNIHKNQWLSNILRLFNHKGHRFTGAFADNCLIAYIDLITIEDTWVFSAIKSITEHLHNRPVDALYFDLLSKASVSIECQRVVNGGGEDELESLSRFKAEYGLLPVSIPYYSRTLLPIDRLKRIKSRLSKCI